MVLAGCQGWLGCAFGVGCCWVPAGDAGMAERTAWEGWALGLVVRHGTPRTSNRLTTNGGGLGMGVTESGRFEAGPHSAGSGQVLRGRGRGLGEWWGTFRWNGGGGMTDWGGARRWNAVPASSAGRGRTPEPGCRSPPSLRTWKAARRLASFWIGFRALTPGRFERCCNTKRRP